METFEEEVQRRRVERRVKVKAQFECNLHVNMAKAFEAQQLDVSPNPEENRRRSAVVY
jgi:hypothetical protein